LTMDAAVVVIRDVFTTVCRRMYATVVEPFERISCSLRRSVDAVFLSADVDRSNSLEQTVVPQGS
jgi:hypothetical protein